MALRSARAALALLALAVVAAPSARADPIEAGQLALAGGDVEAARAAWTPLAQAGDPEAQYRLGLLHDLSGGRPEAAALAYHWYRAAAAAGHPAAQFNVAVMHDSGRGVGRDQAEAALWYGRAAAHGHPRARYNLGQLYEAGEGVPRNLDAALVWYRAAGLPAAERRLAALAARRPGAGPTEARGSLAAPTLAATATIAGQPAGTPPTVQLVWTAPAQPAAVRFFVTVLALDEEAPREIASWYADMSATTLRLDPRLAHYAWRVYAVDPRGARYAASAWGRFAIEAPGP